MCGIVTANSSFPEEGEKTVSATSRCEPFVDEHSTPVIKSGTAKKIATSVHDCSCCDGSTVTNSCDDDVSSNACCACEGDKTTSVIIVGKVTTPLEE